MEGKKRWKLRRREQGKESLSLSQEAWKKLKRDKLAMIGLYFIVIAAVVASLGSLIRPDETPDADGQILQVSEKKPGFTGKFLKFRKNEIVEQVPFYERLFLGGQRSEYTMIPYESVKFTDKEVVIEEYTGKLKKYKDNTRLGGGQTNRYEKLLSFNFADVIYPIEKDKRRLRKGENFTFDQKGHVMFSVLEEGKQKMKLRDLKKVVEEEHLVEVTYWLGTDLYGRDMLSRLMAGTFVSLSIGFISVFISIIIGVMLGALAGYYRGRVDEVIMWIINVVWSIPTLLLVIAITFALGKGFWQIFVAVGLTMWVEVARVVRGQVISIREKEFVEAGKALGFSNSRIIGKHVMPNIFGPVIVISAANFASAILIESGLSFLGIGVQPPMASWGRMIKDHYGYIMLDGAYLAVLPGLAIMVMVLSFMLIGNGLRDALDTKSAGTLA